MARRHRIILNKLDPVALNRYQIAEKDIRVIERYLKIIQRGFGASTWQNITEFDGAYATSLVIHEITEIRWLHKQGYDLLELDTLALQRLLAKEIEAHIVALYEEHLYLQEYIKRVYQQSFEVATLIRANHEDDRELQLFLESSIGIYIFEEDRVSEAKLVIRNIKKA
ncbi:MAG: hypothetical protein AAF629_16570 [Chloroflexota bacterium]